MRTPVTADRDSSSQGLTIDPRRAIGTIVLAALLVTAAVALLGRFARREELTAALGEADRRWLPLCVVGVMAAYAGYIAAYRDLARAEGGPSLSYRAVSRVVAVGFGVSALGASAGGLAVDYWALRRAGAEPPDAARRVLALNTLEWAALGAAACVAGAVVLAAGGSGVPPAMALTWLALVPLCVLAAAWVSSDRRAGRLTMAGGPSVAVSRDPRTWPAWAWHGIQRGFAHSVAGLVLLRRVVARPRRHVLGLAGFPLYWAGHIVCLWAALRAFGPAPAVAPLVLAFMTGYVATAIPLPAGGAGGIEASLALTVHVVGVPLSSAVLGVLLYRAVTFWLPVIPALLVLPSVRRLDEELSSTPDRMRTAPVHHAAVGGR